MPLDTYLGRCRVIHLIGMRGAVRPEQVAARLADCPPRVLFRTYACAPQGAWDSDFSTVAPETIDLLAAHGVKLVGLDTLARPRERHHHACPPRGVPPRHGDPRGLVLDAAEETDYELIALPLKLAGLDASPVRAVLRPLAGS